MALLFANPSLLLVQAKCVFEYDAENDDELSLKVGDIVAILAQEDEGWWEGEVGGKHGIFPSNFVEMIEDEAGAASVVRENAAGNTTVSAIPCLLCSSRLPHLSAFSTLQPKPKKHLGGVGLGNIFAGGAIQLKKTSGPTKKPADTPQPVRETIALKPTKASLTAPKQPPAPAVKVQKAKVRWA